jgi:ribosomal RNA-processing protein 12
LLPLLKVHVRHTTLLFWGEQLLPLAMTLFGEHARATSAGAPVADLKAMRTLVEQLFDSLSGFCTLPEDLPTVWKPLAERLAKLLEGDETAFARPAVCRAITVLITKHQLAIKDLEIEEAKANGVAPPMTSAIPSTTSEGKAEKKANKKAASASSKPKKDAELPSAAAIAAMLPKYPAHVTIESCRRNITMIAAFAKNFLPRLFNIAEQVDSDRRGPLLETISAYASITSPDLLDTLCRTITKRLLAATATISDTLSDDELVARTRNIEVLMDISQPLTPSINAESADFLYRAVVGVLKDKASPILQKKAYRVIGSIVKLQEAYFKTHWRTVVTDLKAAFETTSAGATKRRIQCMKYVMGRVPAMLVEPQVLSILPSFIGEVITATKEANVKTRAVAYDVLVTLGDKMLSTPLSDEVVAKLKLREEAMRLPHPLMAEYIWMLCGGIAGKAHMQSATILCLARLIYEFKGRLTPQMLNEVLGVVLPVLKTEQREVVKV